MGTDDGTAAGSWPATPSRTSRILVALASLLAVVAGPWLLFSPTTSGVVTTVTSAGALTVEATRTSMWSTGGLGSATLLLTPAAIAAAPLLIRARRGYRIAVIAVTIILWTFSVLGLLSIGAFFLPSAAAMLFAAIAPGPRRRPHEVEMPA